MPPPYAELHCLSNFTFLRGASHPEELIAWAHALGYEALALTDECSLAGVVRAHVAAKTCGLALLIGTEVRITDGPRLVLLATDRDAYGDLSALITTGRRRAGKGRYQLRRADLKTGLCACLALLLPEDLPRDEEEARWLARRFPGRAWIAVELVRGGTDRARLRRLEGLARIPACRSARRGMYTCTAASGGPCRIRSPPSGSGPRSSPRVTPSTRTASAISAIGRRCPVFIQRGS